MTVAKTSVSGLLDAIAAVVGQDGSSGGYRRPVFSAAELELRE